MATDFETLLFKGNIHPHLKNHLVKVESESDRKKMPSSESLILHWFKGITVVTGLFLLKLATHMQDEEQDLTVVIKATSGAVKANVN